MDDNFSSIYTATLWGRNIIDNIRKFLQFQLCVNIVCVTIVFIGGATLGKSPFSIIQLLWVNLIMDTLAAIGLASEPPLKEHHDEKDDHGHAQKESSRRENQKIIKEVMWRNVLVQSAYQILVLVVMLYSAPFWFENSTYDLVNTDFYDEDEVAAKNLKTHYTMLFNTFIWMNLAYQISCRKIGWNELNIFEHWNNNSWFIFVVAAEFGIQCLIIEFPLCWSIFRTEHLQWK